MSDKPSSAEDLIAFRNELLKGGFSDGLADDLVRETHARLLDQGLPFTVKVPEPSRDIADLVADAARAAAVELIGALGIKP